jgi:hypothetical protein
MTMQNATMHRTNNRYVKLMCVNDELALWEPVPFVITSSVIVLTDLLLLLETEAAATMLQL